MTHNELFDIIAGALVTALIAFGAWIVRKIGIHDTALAILVSQVDPPNGKSLRDILYDIQIKQASQQEK